MLTYRYVYFVRDLQTGKKYIGKKKTNNINEVYYGSGKHIRAVKDEYKSKYGNDWERHFEQRFNKVIIQFFDTDEEMNDAEKYWIDFYSARKTDEFYNIIKGDKSWGSGYGKKNTFYDDHRFTGENNPFYGKHHSDETRAIMREHSPDKCGENNSFYGKHHSDDTKQLLREIQSGGNNNKTVRVKMLFNGEEHNFGCTKGCAEYLVLNNILKYNPRTLRNYILECFKGRREDVFGIKFTFYR